MFMSHNFKLVLSEIIFYIPWSPDFLDLICRICIDFGVFLEIIDGSILSYRITTFLQLRIKTRRIINQWKCEFNYSATHANSSSINFRFIYHFILKRNAFTQLLSGLVEPGRKGQIRPPYDYKQTAWPHLVLGFQFYRPCSVQHQIRVGFIWTVVWIWNLGAD